MARILFTLLFACVSVGLSADTFTVDSTGDGSGSGTLRWAIEAHTAAGGTNEIRFDKSLSGQVIPLSADLPPINNGTLTIDGSGAPGMSIEGSPDGSIFVIDGSPHVELRDLTLGNSVGPHGGSCLRLRAGDAEIVVLRSRFIGCETVDFDGFGIGGGAVAIEFNQNGPGRLTVMESVFVNNHARSEAGGAVGGAVSVNGGHSILLERNTFQGNSSEAGGSAIARGGAVYVFNVDATILHNEFRSNHAPRGRGGALAMAQPLTRFGALRSNLFERNSSAEGAGVWVDNWTLTLGRPSFEFTQNTFVSNTSDSKAGGALFLQGGDLSIRSNTFADNSNLSGGGANFAFIPLVEFVSFWNNLFGPAASPSCAIDGVTTVPFPSSGFNLRPDDSCGLDGLNDIVGDAGAFLPLGDYGGPTRTLPPAAGNLALDRANPLLPGVGDPALCPPFDARGAPRPADGDGDGIAVCDIGAVEWLVEAPIFVDGFESVRLSLP